MRLVSPSTASYPRFRLRTEARFRRSYAHFKLKAQEVVPPPPQPPKVLDQQNCDPAEQLDLQEISLRVVALAQVMLGKRFYPYQIKLALRIVESLLLHDGAVVTSLFSRQAGKTECIGGTVAACAVILPYLARKHPKDWKLNITDSQGRYRGFASGLLVGIYAPRLEQSEITFHRVKLAMESRSTEKVLKELAVSAEINNGNTYALSNGSRIACQSASPQSKIEGATHHLLVAEEAQDIDDTKMRKCFASDTLFPQPDGQHRTIKEIVARRLPVLTPEGWMQQGVEYHVNGVQPVFEVTLRGGKRITLTANHRMPAYARGWKKLRVLEVKDLRPGRHRLVVPDALPFFGAVGDRDEGYLLGSILGDGCTSGRTVQFMGSWKQIRRMMPVLRKLHTTVSARKEVAPGVWAFSFAGRRRGESALRQFFKQFGLLQLTGKNKHLPERAWSADFLTGLIEGLFETDGSVEGYDSKPCISYASISFRLAEAVKDHLMRFGIHATLHESFSRSTELPGLRENKGCRFWRLHIKSVEDIRRFSAIFDLGIKQWKLERALHTIACRQPRKWRTELGRQIRLEAIRSIRFAGEAETYCVTVPTEAHEVITARFHANQSLHPMTASTMGTIVKIGTAGMQKCDFYNSIQTNRRMQLAGGTQNHYFYPWKVCASYNSLYGRYIEGEKNRIGEDSDEFRMSYEGEWIFERGMFITADVLLHSSRAQVTGQWSDYWRSGFHLLRNYSLVAGIDWGSINDSTVVCLMAVDWNSPVETGEMVGIDGSVLSYTFYRKHVIGWLEFSGDNYEFQYREILRILKALPILRKVVTDSNACGKPLFDRLEADLSHYGVEMVPFNFSAKLKSEGYKQLAMEMAAARITYPASEATRKTLTYKRFTMQMLDLRKTYQNGLLAVSHPDERGAHDDYPDALMLANYGASVAVNGNRLEFKERNPFYT